MRIFFSVIAFFCLLNMQANAQFKYDAQKVSAIRWSQTPESVAGVNAIKIDLNGQWNFTTMPEDNFWKKNQVSGWKSIDVPGEWVMQGFEVEKGKAAGYHRNFQIPSAWNGYRIKLKCEAVYSECQIWINGKPAGSHIGGFTPFELDVTEQVKKGENSITMAVKSESLADTMSSASQYAVHPLGGISRPIYLVVMPDVNIASFHVTTVFDKYYADATLNAYFTVVNEGSTNQKAELRLTLKDANGKTVTTEGENNLTINTTAGSKNKVITALKITKPAQWDTEHPNLYFLECSVSVNGKEVVKNTRRFGFRQIEVKGNQVFVNNHPIKLKGVCRHEVDPLRGRSLVGNQWYEDVKLFKEANINYIRTSHYPPNDKLFEACDELGMFAEEEAPFCWASKNPVTDANYFTAVLQPTLEMVERDKSHPSIIHWSLGNESYNFKELYKTSGDLVKEADPTRPRIFSQYSEEVDEGYLELGNHHYPGPTGPSKYRDNKRPVIFDEYCHLNAYNRYELMTDPGVRDFWGDILLKMWENMYYSKGVLGGALWAGIDDSFFLPSGKVVGYGTWGPVDGWRRPKPEYWHMKKIFTPVKIKLMDGLADSLVTLEIENRYFFSNLNECRFSWINGDKKGTVQPNIKQGEKGKVKLPITYASLQKLTVDVFHNSAVPVDQYMFDFEKPVLAEIAAETGTFKWSKNGAVQVAEGNGIKVAVSNETIVISDRSGREIINGWPSLMLVGLNGGGDTQMTKETPDYEIYSPAASNRMIKNIELVKETSGMKVSVSDTYDEAAGKITLIISANGAITVDYQYKMLADANLRQWGVSFSFPQTMNTFSWKRKGLWSVYPEDHIARTEGTAKLFYTHENCGLAGPSKKPDWSYNKDQTRYGSNDFRSTKRNVLSATLASENASGLIVNSCGLQHIRCWTQDNLVHMLIAEYDNPGAERFLRNFVDHAAKFDLPLKQGQKISGQITMQIVNVK